MEVKDTIAARKVQKADREKLRRDRQNEQFLELGNTLGKLWRFINCLIAIFDQVVLDLQMLLEKLSLSSS